MAQDEISEILPTPMKSVPGAGEVLGIHNSLTPIGAYM
jgi:hypothetical protein